jgi:hypothetical protein
MSAKPAQKRVLVPIGPGSEEIESASIVDVLARAVRLGKQILRGIPGPDSLVCSSPNFP